LTLLEGDRYTAGRLQRISSLEFEPLDQFHQRRKKLTEIEALGHASYPHRFEWTHTAKQVAENFGERTAEQLAAEHVDVCVAGHIIAFRPHGKAAFGHILGDGSRCGKFLRLCVN
jgi:lysyl-tRNA synthetase class 2